MKLPIILSALICGAPLYLHAQGFDFNFLSATNPTPNNAAEFLTYTKDGFRVGATFSANTDPNPANHTYGVVTYQMNSAGALLNETVINFQPSFPAANVTSAAFDPLQRGFGAVAMFPTLDQDVLGRVGFFNYRTGEIFGTVETGFHPDSIVFSPDGTKMIVLNEGEHPLDFATSGKSTPGSISVFDLTGVPDVNVAPPGLFTSLPSITRDFSGVDISQARIIPGGTMPAFHQPEPEFAAFVGNTVYVTLQEANAVGVFNIAPVLSQSNWTAVRGLGTITQTVDASIEDGPGGLSVADQNDVVRGLPMPDTIATYTANGVAYYVTANEGDARLDDSDAAAVATLASEGKLDPSLTTGAGDITTEDKLGGLSISRNDGDTDADGDIDVPTMLGTRSFSIWRASDGALVYDSGSLETVVLALDPTTHNINRRLNSFDARSVAKGPEPEAVTIGVVNGRTYAVIGAERQNGLFAFDITDPAAVTISDYFNVLTDADATNNFLLSPESLIFVPAADNPTGLPLILGGHEGSGLANNTDGILVISAQVPEPSTAAIFLLGLGWALGVRRRK